LMILKFLWHFPIFIIFVQAFSFLKTSFRFQVIWQEQKEAYFGQIKLSWFDFLQSPAPGVNDIRYHRQKWKYLYFQFQCVSSCHLLLCISIYCLYVTYCDLKTRISAPAPINIVLAICSL
jgi:hypothetical protein